MHKILFVFILFLLSFLSQNLTSSVEAATTPPATPTTSQNAPKTAELSDAEVQALEAKAQKAFASQQYALAEKSYFQLLAIYEHRDGTTPPQVLHIFRRIAECIAGVGNYAEAEKILRETVQTSAKNLGENHEETLKTQYALAQVLLTRTKFIEALKVLNPLYKQQLTLLGAKDKATYTTLTTLTRTYFITGFFKRAVEPLTHLLRVTPGLFGENHELTIQSRLLYALFLDATGDYTLSVEVLSAAIKQAITHLGTKHALTFELFSALAAVYAHAGEKDKALKQYTNLAKRQQALFDENHPQVLKTLSELAYSRRTKENLAQIEAELTTIAQKQTKILGPNHLDTLTTTKNLALIYMDQRKFSKASKLIAELLTKAPLFGEHSPLVLAAYAAIAQAFYDNEELASALRIYKTLLEKQKTAFGEETKSMQATASIIAQIEKEASSKPAPEKEVPAALLQEKNDATAMMNAGNNTNALIRFENIYQQYQEIVGKNDIRTLQVAHTLANLYEIAGELDTAEKLLEQLLPQFTKLLGENHTDTLTIRYSLQHIHSEQGYHRNTVAETKAIYDQLQTAHGITHADTFAQGINLADAYNQVKDYSSAIALLEHNIPLGKQAFGEKNKLVLMAEILLSSTYNKRGQADKALELLNPILHIVTTDDALKKQFYIALFKMYAHIYAQKGKKEDSIRFYFKALLEENKHNGKYHLTFLELLRDMTQIMATTESERVRAFKYTNIGIGRSLLQREPSDTLFQTFFDTLKNISQQTQQEEAAIFFSKMSILASKAQRQRNVGLEREYQQTYLNSQLFIYHEAIHLLAQAKRTQEAFTVLNLLKESELDDVSYQKIANETTLNQFFTPVEAKAYKEFLAFAKKFKALGEKLIPLNLRKDYLTSQEVEHLDTLYAQEKKLLQQLLAFFEGLQTRLDIQSSSRQTAFASDNVHMLQSILKSNPKSVFIHTVSTHNGLYVFLTSSNNFVMRHIPVSSNEIHALVTQFRSQLINPQLDPKFTAQKLYTLLISPLEKNLQSLQPQTLAFSLDGALRYIPMSALFNENQWLIEKYNVVNFTDAAREALLKQNSRKKHIAAMGLTQALQGFSALPAVKHEIDSIVKEGETGILQGKKYMDAQFTQHTLQETLQQRTPLIHVASHFQFDPHEQKNSFLLLGDGKKLRMGTMFASKSPLSFAHVDLLTLSACDTASGLQKGDGREIESFGALAQKRGAGAVLATLWPVADASTAAFMQEFYRQLGLKSQSKATALSLTQRQFLKKTITLRKENTTRGRLLTVSATTPAASSFSAWQHPYFWAPFILMGNWK